MRMIPFNIPPFIGNEDEYMKKAIENHKICGDGEFTKKCNSWIEQRTGTGKALLTTSCTHALELAAILLDIQPGDEVIMPSYTFVSTADAFVLRGAKTVFVDIRPDTMNIDETLIEDAVTEKTKAIVPVHYAGVSCEMDKIMEIAKKYGLAVVEDAAQGVLFQLLSIGQRPGQFLGVGVLRLGAVIKPDAVNAIGRPQHRSGRRGRGCRPGCDQMTLFHMYIPRVEPDMCSSTQYSKIGKIVQCSARTLTITGSYKNI